MRICNLELEFARLDVTRYFDIKDEHTLQTKLREDFPQSLNEEQLQRLIYYINTDK